jgi:DNA-binding transcriptional MerR regulator
MTADDSFNRLDDDDYPAYTMGRAAAILGTTQGFLRAIGEARLITPLRSEGGHRRYSRYQLRIAARARELVDQGTPIEAPAASSSSKTNSRKPSASTPNTAAPHPGTRKTTDRTAATRRNPHPLHPFPNMSA